MTYILICLMALFLSNTSAQAKTDDIVVKINGMVCDFCAQSLEKVFTKEDSVHGITVSLEDQTVTVDTKDQQALSDKKIKELIDWAGYDLVEIKRN